MQRSSHAFGFVLALIAVLEGSPYVVAQGPTQTGAGPTMQQTVDFIQTAFTKEGVFSSGNATFQSQSVTLISDCKVLLNVTVLREKVRYEAGELDLRDSDLASIAVSQELGVAEVKLERAAFHQQVPAIKAERTLQFHAGQPFPEEREFIAGIVESIQDGKIVIVTDEGIRVAATVDGATHATDFDSNRRATDTYRPILMAQVEVGDLVSLEAESMKDKKGDLKYKGGHAIQDGSLWITLIRKQQKGRRPAQLGYFQDKDTAERVAKAYVHAMVLCHKDDKPSLF